MLCSICSYEDDDCFRCPQCGDPVCMECGRRHATVKRKKPSSTIGCITCGNVHNFRSTWVKHRDFVYSRDVHAMYGSADSIDTQIHSFDEVAGWGA
jgi:transcription elongation factor Elf1